ncbi:hypothetical protein [Halalkalibacter hemicellulosilyticus]|uniref:Nudix hydrolase domain-containing protein n=1 Tax=Halalkalibacter hemicellulosilyticusJCM 9152 TaxID=1236971 RepID=W4QCC6_9BACI|nr:hypothetical protein [Halalkalibacter hemicellulosilyticus]GAE29685.1 hypothetical protein JCM9152_1060 [Halalkalibacter hemicellulosilyticusJCM 9152]
MLLVDSIKVYLNDEKTNDFDSVLVVLFKGDKLVMVKNKKRGWEFPGGHREGHRHWDKVLDHSDTVHLC